MRRLCVKLALFVAVVLVGCEDGPNQTYKVAPSGAGQQWNDGNTSPTVATNATQTTDARYPTAGKTTICSTDLKRERWGWMLNQPIIPPRFYAGLDMAKDDLWHGLGIEDAEARPEDPSAPGGGLCQSVPQGFVGQCPSGIGYCNGNFWGNAGEVQFSWNLATHKIDQFTINLGYLGAFTAKSKDGKNTFVMKLGDVIKRDDGGGLKPFLLDWTGDPRRAITEFYNAAIATHGPAAGLAPIDTAKDANGHDISCNIDADCGMKADAAHPFCISNTCVPNCGGDGSCLVTSGGGQWFMGFRQLVFYTVGNTGVPQPALSTPVLWYNFASRFEPFGNLPQVLKLDAEGPVAFGPPLGARDSSIVCNQKVGVKFGDVRKTCVQVHGPVGSPDMVDQVNLNKLLNGLTHDQEHWTANAIGVNQNFTSEKVVNNPDLVVLDEDTPQDGDFAQDFFFDLRARGHPRNDYNTYAKGKGIIQPGFSRGIVDGGAAFGASADFRGTALIHVEWARLMLEDAARVMKAAGLIPKTQAPKKLGDPDCTNGVFKAGCTGIEGLMIPTVGRGDFTTDASCAAGSTTCLDPGTNWDSNGYFVFASHLKPGDVSPASASIRGPRRTASRRSRAATLPRSTPRSTGSRRASGRATSTWSRTSSVTVASTSSGMRWRS